MFRVDSEVWMIAFVGKERGDTSSRAWSVIVGKFGKGE